MAPKAGKRGKKRGKPNWLEFAAIATAFTGVFVLLVEFAFPHVPGREFIEQLDLVAVAILGVLLLIEFARAGSKRLFLKKHWLDIAVILPFMVALRVLREMRAEIVLGKNVARALVAVIEPGVLLLERTKKVVGSVLSIKTMAEVARKMLKL